MYADCYQTTDAIRGMTNKFARFRWAISLFFTGEESDEKDKNLRRFRGFIGGALFLAFAGVGS
jgi:hypothetical protein